MAGKSAATQSAAAFEFELLEEDHDRLRTVVATRNPISPWIDSATLKLRHRIGRGPFGDVWLATQHLSTEDYDEYHEVAIKMLHPIREDHMNAVLVKLENLFCKCQGLKGVCWLHGISVISGKVSHLYIYSILCGDFVIFLTFGLLYILLDLHYHEIL